MTTIKEDYVSFEIAKLLKEKGFEGKCHLFSDTSTKTFGKVWNTESTVTVPIPTLQMTMKWLREEHDIHIAINICYTENPKLFQPDYYVCVSSTVTGESLIKEMCPLVQDKSLTPKGFTSYEETCESAIKYCLENLI